MTRLAITSNDSGVEAAAWSSLCCLGGREALQMLCGKVHLFRATGGLHNALDGSAFIEC